MTSFSAKRALVPENANRSCSPLRLRKRFYHQDKYDSTARSYLCNPGGVRRDSDLASNFPESQDYDNSLLHRQGRASWPPFPSCFRGRLCRVPAEPFWTPLDRSFRRLPNRAALNDSFRSNGADKSAHNSKGISDQVLIQSGGHGPKRSTA